MGNFKKVTNLMGGDIAVESEIGKGFHDHAADGAETVTVFWIFDFGSLKFSLPPGEGKGEGAT
jgi:hypothetical protein